MQLSTSKLKSTLMSLISSNSQFSTLSSMQMYFNRCPLFRHGHGLNQVGGTFIGRLDNFIWQNIGISWSEIMLLHYNIGPNKPCHLQFSIPKLFLREGWNQRSRNRTATVHGRKSSKLRPYVISYIRLIHSQNPPFAGSTSCYTKQSLLHRGWRKIYQWHI